MMSSLTHKTITGVFWSFLQQVSSRGVAVLVTLVLTYYLSPEDFGLMAMMMVFLSIANVFMDSGFLQALIRMTNVSQADFNTGFYANVGLGAVGYLLLFFSAPFIASFYESPQLVNLIRVAALSVVINSFRVVHFANLIRAMDFKAQFKAIFPATLLSGVIAIIVSYYGFGVWALIVQMLVSSLLTTVFLGGLSRWRPGLKISLRSLSSMYGFGYKLFLSGLLETVFRNLYVLVIAKLFSTSTAGLYFLADRIREAVVFQLVSSIQSVTYPVLCQFNSDLIGLKQACRKVLSIFSFVFFPFVIFLVALSEPLFKVVLEEEWWAGIIYFQLMCVAGVLIPIHAVNLDVLKVLGRSDVFLLLEVVKKAMAVAVLLATFRFGVVAILFGQILSSVLAYFPNSYYSNRLLGYTLVEQLSDFFPSLLLAGVVGVWLWWAQFLLDWYPLYEFFLLGSVGVFLYFSGAYLFKLKAFWFFREAFVKYRG